MKKCPVCDWDITDHGVTVMVGGKQVTVCCEECAAKASAESAKRAKGDPAR